MSDDSRANRLRSRRGRARQRAEDRQRDAGRDPTDRPDESSEPDGSSEPASTDGASTDGAADGAATNDDGTGAETDDDAGSVKDERVGTYMYLPESQKRELERVYGTLKVQFEYEYDEEFEKNRHFFPAVVRHGLETLDGMDPEEVRALLDDE